MTASQIIDVTNLAYSINNQKILEHVNMYVSGGEFVLITGENGAGKTTFMKLLLGLLTPDSGSISLFGVPIKEFVDFKKIGYLSQNVYQTLGDVPITVDEFIRAGCLDMRQYQDRFEELDTIFKVSSYTHKLVSDLSGGQIQRVFLVRSMINNPEILFLDEPTTGIDSDSKHGLINQLKTLKKDGLTVIAVSHDKESFKDLYDKVYCVKECALCSTKDVELINTI